MGSVVSVVKATQALMWLWYCETDKERRRREVTVKSSDGGERTRIKIFFCEPRLLVCPGSGQRDNVWAPFGPENPSDRV